jgi:hypothetical protein
MTFLRYVNTDKSILYYSFTRYQEKVGKEFMKSWEKRDKRGENYWRLTTQIYDGWRSTFKAHGSIWFVLSRRGRDLNNTADLSPLSLSQHKQDLSYTTAYVSMFMNYKEHSILSALEVGTVGTSYVTEKQFWNWFQDFSVFQYWNSSSANNKFVFRSTQQTSLYNPQFIQDNCV